MNNYYNFCLLDRHVDAFCLATYKNVPVCHFCSPEGDRNGRNVVYIDDFALRHLQQVRTSYKQYEKNKNCDLYVFLVIYRRNSKLHVALLK